MGNRAFIRNLLWSISVMLLVAAVGWGILGGGDQSGEEDDEAESSTAASPPLTLRDLHMEEFDQEGKQVDLWGRIARFSRRDGRAQIEDIRILWSPQQGKPSEDFELRGTEGTYDLSGQIAVIRGDVEMRSWDGYRLQTDMVRYDSKRYLIEGPGTVHIEGPEGITDGEGLQVDMKEETFVLREQVRTLIRPSALEKAKRDIP